MDQAALQHHWDAFYRDNHTGCGSGLGSLISSTADYRHLLENFIRLNRPERVLDLGCGDWQSTKLVPWREYGMTYLGADVSPFVINRNKAMFASASTEFVVVSEPADLKTLGRFDLIICKDVLQHTPNCVASAYLDVFCEISRTSLITNDAFPQDRLNNDIKAGDWRPVDIRQTPFRRSSVVLFEYANFEGDRYWIKHVHLLPGSF